MTAIAIDEHDDIIDTPTETVAEDAATADVAEQERWRVVIGRNPVVKIVDALNEAPAPGWKDHQRFANEQAATFGIGDLFAVVQPRGGKGFWATEWTVVLDVKSYDRKAVRRRAGVGKTPDAAVEAMALHNSHHNSHYFQPEEGFWARFNR